MRKKTFVRIRSHITFFSGIEKNLPLIQILQGDIRHFSANFVIPNIPSGCLDWQLIILADIGYKVLQESPISCQIISLVSVIHLHFLRTDFFQKSWTSTIITTNILAFSFATIITLQTFRTRRLLL